MAAPHLNLLVLLLAVSVAFAGCGGGGGGGGGSSSSDPLLLSSDFEDPGNREIYRWDGRAVTRLTSAVGDDIYPHAVGNIIVFISRRNGNEEVFRMNADGTQQLAITDNTASGDSDSFPRLSPNGQQVVFWRSIIATGNIYRVNIDGSGLTQLTFDGASVSPCWNPQGTKIAFARGGAIWTMDPDGANQAQLTTDVTTAFEPAWRGSLIVFTGMRDGVGGTFVVSQSGGPSTRLSSSPGGGWDETSAFSADGQSIVYSRSGDLRRTHLSTPGVSELVLDLGGNEGTAALAP